MMAEKAFWFVLGVVLAWLWLEHDKPRRPRSKSASSSPPSSRTSAPGPGGGEQQAGGKGWEGEK
jgi:hypothetical protein